MDKIPSIVFESPVQGCAASLMVASLGYFTIKGLRMLLQRGETLSLPPGPPRELLLGAMRSYPKGHPLERFNEWAITYGTCFG
jgi:hypothetical protein